ncbi:MAG TPA: MFS transporter [Chloroflexota bacterium]
MPWSQVAVGFSVATGVMVALINIAPVLPLIREDFGLTNAWAGILSSATFFTHTLLQFLGGVVSDRLGLKRTLLLGLGVIVVAMIASALAPDLSLLLAARLLVGIGTSLSFISALAYVNEITPLRSRQVVQGMFGASANIGVLLVMVTAGSLALLIGWRGSFLVEGAAVLVVLGVVAARLRPDLEFSSDTSAPWGEVLRHRHLYLLGLAHVMTYGAFTGISAWAVTFLWEQHAVGLEWAGVLAALLPAAAILSRTVGGKLSMGREKTAIVTSCGIAAAGIGVMALVPGTVPALIILAIVGWFAAMPFGAIFSYSSLIGGARSSGRDLTLVNFIGNLGALGFPPAVGYAVDLTGSFAAGFGVIAAIGVVGCATVVAWLPSPTSSRSRP